MKPYGQLKITTYVVLNYEVLESDTQRGKTVTLASIRCTLDDAPHVLEQFRMDNPHIEQFRLNGEFVYREVL